MFKKFTNNIIYLSNSFEFVKIYEKKSQNLLHSNTLITSALVPTHSGVKSLKFNQNFYFYKIIKHFLITNKS